MSSASAPLDEAVVARVRASFARQGALATLGAELAVDAHAEQGAERVHVATLLAPVVRRRAG